ncbi:MAG: short-chain dehydrogenase [Lautropia sp.]|nr:MAG: SDR family oxidoreductase [Pseudomonadota bacterium]MBC6960282.1 short-chain dehydrogenase [Lautropia sp.]MCL4701993.1 SDR family oxidoreductase [Burkholderiaceae bacterium]MDL1906091.1 SDR family oxidoreductase [Betaproteobacteria bacterium PRO1]RIK91419.1 MAG: short-chain dehydrogenase [Burkholderiales bacterium]
MKVFITGASGGIGEALAREYHRRFPASTIGLAARRADELARVAAALAGASVHRYRLDVTDRDALARAAADFVGLDGAPPDVVIANAGISAGTLTGEPADAAVFRRIVDVNVTGMFDTFAPFVPGMRARGAGRLVGIASVAGIRGLPGAGAYSASKAATIAYLESLRVELRGSGVRVVTIAPGYIRTPMTERNAYPMPFLTDADAFARRALDAIARGDSYLVIPRPMGAVALGLRLLPNWLFDRLFARAPRKRRAAGGGAERAAEQGERAGTPLACDAHPGAQGREVRR